MIVFPDDNIAKDIDPCWWENTEAMLVKVHKNEIEYIICRFPTFTLEEEYLVDLIAQGLNWTKNLK